MAKRGKPLGNKRQRERDKARKKREKEARREARKTGTDDEPGEDDAATPVEGEAGGDDGQAGSTEAREEPAADSRERSEGGTD